MTKEFNGILIKFDGEQKISLTDLWKASGSVAHQKPVQWLRLPETSKFNNAVSQKLKVGLSHLLETTKGRTGGTFAHWQIALAYAKYLSPELHMFVNECFKDRMEEEQNPELAISRGRERAIRHWKKIGMDSKWIEQRINAIESRLNLNQTIASLCSDKRAFSLCGGEINKPILGETATQRRGRLGLPKSKPIRETCDAEELAALALVDLVATRRLHEKGVKGNSACQKVCKETAMAIASAIV